MSIKYSNTPDGLFVSMHGQLGCLNATIHRPEKSNGRKTWTLCFAACSGEARSLIGKVLERNTLEAVKHELERYDRDLNPHNESQRKVKQWANTCYCQAEPK